MKRKQYSGLRKASHLGDAELFKWPLTASEIVQIAKAKGWARFIIFAKVLLFIRTLLNYSVIIPLRRSFGKKTCGVIANYIILSLLVIINSTQIPWLLKPIVWVLSPVFGFIYRGDLVGIIFENLHSVPMLIYTLLFFGFSTFNVLQSWFWNKQPDYTKRGESYLMKIPFFADRDLEYMVQGILEPLIWVLTGYAFFYFAHDIVFASFLWAGASSLFVLELADLRNQRSAGGGSMNQDTQRSQIGF